MDKAEIIMIVLNSLLATPLIWLMIFLVTRKPFKAKDISKGLGVPNAPPKGTEWNKIDVNALIKYGKRLSKIKGKQIEVIELPFLTVKETIPALIKHSRILEVVSTVMESMGITEPLTDREVMAIFLYIYDETCTDKEGSIPWLEKNFLAGQPNAELIAAGSASLGEYDAHLTLRNLCNNNMRDALKMGEERSYSMIFDLQLMINKVNKVENNYSGIIRNKQKASLR